MYKNKNLEYYLDSRIYTNEEVQKSIEETKREFPNKNVEVKITLNEFGMYIITFKFEDQDTYFNKIKINIWEKFRKNKSSDKKIYGQYKETKIYKPY